jgi:hypothetical protein
VCPDAWIGGGTGAFHDTHDGRVVYTPAGIAVVAKGEELGFERASRSAGRFPREEVLLDHEPGGTITIPAEAMRPPALPAVLAAR